MGSVLDRRQPDLTVLLEQVSKPHNLSAIVRNCDAVGVLDLHVVWAGPRLAVDRDTSAGTGKWVTVHEHGTTSAAIDHLHGRGFQVVAADLGAGSVDFRSVDYTRPTGFLMGSELDGVTEEALAASDRRVRIPMVGMVRSLNLSVATALLLYEAFRQREEAGFYTTSRLGADDRARRHFEWAHPELAERCRRMGHPYPALDEQGEIVGSLERILGKRD